VTIFPSPLALSELIGEAQLQRGVQRHSLAFEDRLERQLGPERQSRVRRQRPVHATAGAGARRDLAAQALKEDPIAQVLLEI